MSKSHCSVRHNCSAGVLLTTWIFMHFEALKFQFLKFKALLKRKFFPVSNLAIFLEGPINFRGFNWITVQYVKFDRPNFPVINYVKTRKAKQNWFCFILLFLSIFYCVNPLNPNCDKHLISPYNIPTLSNIQVMRIKKAITKHEMCWCLCKFSQLVP